MSCESWSGTRTYVEFQSCAASERRCDGAVLFMQSEGAMSCESWSGTRTCMEFQSCAASGRRCDGAILFCNRRAPCRVRVGRARAHAWSFSPAL